MYLNFSNFLVNHFSSWHASTQSYCAIALHFFNFLHTYSCSSQSIFWCSLLKYCIARQASQACNPSIFLQVKHPLNRALPLVNCVLPCLPISEGISDVKLLVVVSHLGLLQTGSHQVRTFGSGMFRNGTGAWWTRLVGFVRSWQILNEAARHSCWWGMLEWAVASTNSCK